MNNSPLQAPLNRNRPVHVEGYGIGEQHSGYEPYDDVYMRRHEMRGSQGDPREVHGR